MINRRRKIYYNISISAFTQILIILLSFFVPRLFISSYGSDVNGLVGTITQVLTYVALIESGIGAVTQNALYKPILNDDKKEICIILTASKKYYERVTIYYSLTVITIAFFLPLMIQSEVNYWKIFTMVLMEGFSGVLYFLFLEHWKVLLSVEGKEYIIAQIDLFTRVLSYLAKLVLALMMFDILYIQVSYFLITLLSIFLYRCYIKKEYSWVNYTKQCHTISELNDRKYYMLSDIAWTIFLSTDMVIISTMMNTTYASIYSVYNMVYVALSNILFKIYSSIAYVLGQNFHKNIEKYVKIHDTYELSFILLISILMSCCSILTIPFIELYTNGVADIDYIYKFLPFLFGLIHILSWGRYVSGNLMLISGKSKQASQYSIIEASLNIILSITLCIAFGMYGLLTATIIALSYKVVCVNFYANRIIMKRSARGTITRIASNLFIYISIEMYSWWQPLKISTISQFIIDGFVTLILVSSYYIFVNIIINYKTAYMIVGNIYRSLGRQH